MTKARCTQTIPPLSPTPLCRCWTIPPCALASARRHAEPRNRGTAEQHYGWDAHGDDLLRHYQRLLTDLPAPGDCPAEGTATART